MSIAVGQKAPDFTLQDQNKKEVKLSDFAGKKKVVLVFYPLDWSPTCTNEHACFVNDMRNFETLDAEVLGVSVDSVWSHKAYAEKMGIKYSLLADFHPKGAMSEKYGVYMGDKGITGRAIATLFLAVMVAVSLRQSESAAAVSSPVVMMNGKRARRCVARMRSCTFCPSRCWR